MQTSNATGIFSSTVPAAVDVETARDIPDRVTEPLTEMGTALDEVAEALLDAAQADGWVLDLGHSLAGGGVALPVRARRSMTGTARRPSARLIAIMVVPTALISGVME